MSRRHTVSRRLAAALSLVLAAGSPALAQQSQITLLPEEPPAITQYRLGALVVNPTFRVPEMGRDSNVFNTRLAPKEDYVVKVTPEVDYFADFGVWRLTARTGSSLTYYHRFASERSIAPQARGRVMARLSRFRPWVGGAAIHSADRPNAEIDARARRSDTEVGAGAHVEVTPVATVTVSAHQLGVRYAEGAEFRGELLSRELDRTTDMYTAALRLKATPLTTITVNGYTARDRFTTASARNTRSRGGEVEVHFAPEAIVRGRVAVGMKAHTPDDPTMTPYRGANARGGITAILLWRAIVGVNVARDVQYSFDRREGYYVDTAADFVYTQRIGGPFDVQARVARQHLDFGVARRGSSRAEVLNTYQAGLGYALENRSRVGFSYEHAARSGDSWSDRPFSRRRLFGSFTYEFWK